MTIYALLDPRDERLRYVGITTKPLAERLEKHLREAKHATHHRACWLRSLGSVPLIRPLEETDDATRECYWIAHYRALGYDLTNSTDGGDGVTGLSEDARQRMREKRAIQLPPRPKGFVMSDEQKRKISQAQIGKTISPEAREKMRLAKLGKKRGPCSEETKRKIGLANMTAQLGNQNWKGTQHGASN